jgi:hypothetical protein
MPVPPPLCAVLAVGPQERQPIPWYSPDGELLDQPPALADLPDLPAEWIKGLTETHSATAEFDGDSSVVKGHMTDGQPSQRVSDKLADAFVELFGPNRHDKIRDKVLGLLRLGKNGEPGVRHSLRALCKAFVNKLGPARDGGKEEAETEFRNFAYRKVDGKWVIRDEVARLLADPEYDYNETDSAGFFDKQTGLLALDPAKAVMSAITCGFNHRIEQFYVYGDGAWRRDKPA